MSTCDWAACRELAVRHEDGWWHCKTHLAAHRSENDERHRERVIRDLTPAAQLSRVSRQQEILAADQAHQEQLSRTRATVKALHAQGLNDNEIARQLGVSRTTIGQHRRALGLPLHQRTQQHGTHSGYNGHRRRHETPCDACQQGEAAYQQERWKRKQDAQVVQLRRAA